MKRGLLKPEGVRFKKLNRALKEHITRTKHR
ncbi:MAG: hypothetical protein OSP8Acid_13250 [uncultured Acidilobus sp. OSP8]|nr:MAG: hypothetical protein OSP8Acid_13250 [uncultured Acidilobus sp. OSP8]